jgi:hypothetical protein
MEVLSDHDSWPKKEAPASYQEFGFSSRGYGEAPNALFERKIDECRERIKRLDDQKATRQRLDEIEGRARQETVEQLASFEKSLAEFDSRLKKPVVSNRTAREKLFDAIQAFYVESSNNRDVRLVFDLSVLDACSGDETEVGRETGANSRAYVRGLFGPAWGNTVADVAEHARRSQGKITNVLRNERGY